MNTCMVFKAKRTELRQQSYKALTVTVLKWQCDNKVARIRVHNNLTNKTPNLISILILTLTVHTIHKKHAIVNIQLNVVTCPMYPDSFVRDM